MRVIGLDREQIGIRTLGEAINLARAAGVDLVEVAPQASPPVCRIVDYPRWVYEQEKLKKESKKNVSGNKVKELQLSARIDTHDFQMRVSRAVEFLCEGMKVKASLRFRGREMAHKEYGFHVMERFAKELAPFGRPDAAPKLVGRSLRVMFSPLPRHQQAPKPIPAKEPTADPAPDIAAAESA